MTSMCNTFLVLVYWIIGRLEKVDQIPNKLEIAIAEYMLVLAEEKVISPDLTQNFRRDRYLSWRTRVFVNVSQDLRLLFRLRF